MNKILMYQIHGIFLQLPRFKNYATWLPLKFHLHKTLTWSLILQLWVHVPLSFRNFYHLLLLNGLHGEENNLDHQYTPDNNVYIFYQKVWRSAGWLYLSELGSLVSGMGDNQVISSTCCVKIITAQGATTKHLTNNSQIVRRGGKTDSDNNNQIKKNPKIYNE